MIPPFDDHGYLPAGVHPATLEEIEGRFGRETEVRRAQAESLRWLVDLARRAGIGRLVINGSFVTDTPDPNDVDCALLVAADFEIEAGLQEEFEIGLPFLQIELLLAPDFAVMVERVYSSDRDMVPKGVVEVAL